MADSFNYTEGFRLAVTRFLAESNGIEGITREPTDEEVTATLEFLRLPTMTSNAVKYLQSVYAPYMPLRVLRSMNVRVGRHVPMQGGPEVRDALERIVESVNKPDSDPWKDHVDFETVHPFLDGNGRTGRALWAWQTRHQGNNPFSLSFLHRFYYLTLDHIGR